jgi:hypothetical protein
VLQLELKAASPTSLRSPLSLPLSPSNTLGMSPSSPRAPAPSSPVRHDQHLHYFFALPAECTHASFSKYFEMVYHNLFDPPRLAQENPPSQPRDGRVVPREPRGCRAHVADAAARARGRRFARLKNKVAIVKVYPPASFFPPSLVPLSQGANSSYGASSRHQQRQQLHAEASPPSSPNVRQLFAPSTPRSGMMRQGRRSLSPGVRLVTLTPGCQIGYTRTGPAAVRRYLLPYVILVPGLFCTYSKILPPMTS